MRVIICTAVQLYLLVVFLRVLLSWFPFDDGSVLGTLYRGLRVVTEPVLVPLRHVLPRFRFGAVGIDMGPMLVVVAASLAARALCGAAI